MVHRVSRDARTRATFIPGDVVSVRADGGKFAIMKVLVIDGIGICGLLYAKLFADRPRIVNIFGLQTAPPGPIHFALTHDNFALCRPEVIAHRQVTDEELTDYPLWAVNTSDYRARPGGE